MSVSRIYRVTQLGLRVTPFISDLNGCDQLFNKCVKKECNMYASLRFDGVIPKFDVRFVDLDSFFGKVGENSNIVNKINNYLFRLTKLTDNKLYYKTNSLILTDENNTFKLIPSFMSENNFIDLSVVHQTGGLSIESINSLLKSIKSDINHEICYCNTCFSSTDPLYYKVLLKHELLLRGA